MTAAVVVAGGEDLLCVVDALERVELARQRGRGLYDLDRVLERHDDIDRHRAAYRFGFKIQPAARNLAKPVPLRQIDDIDRTLEIIAQSLGRERVPRERRRRFVVDLQPIVVLAHRQIAASRPPHAVQLEHAPARCALNGHVADRALDLDLVARRRQRQCADAAGEYLPGQRLPCVRRAHSAEIRLTHGVHSLAEAQRPHARRHYAPGFDLGPVDVGLAQPGDVCVRPRARASLPEPDARRAVIPSSHDGASGRGAAASSLQRPRVVRRADTRGPRRHRTRSIPRPHRATRLPRSGAPDTAGSARRALFRVWLRWPRRRRQ